MKKRNWWSWGLLGALSTPIAFLAVACANSQDASQSNTSQLINQANKLTLADFNYAGQAIDTNANINTYHEAQNFTLKNTQGNFSIKINSVNIQGRSLIIKYVYTSGGISTPELTLIDSNFHDESTLLKYLNDNLKLSDIQEAANDKLAFLNKEVSDWNAANPDPKLHITVVKSEVSDLAWENKKISYTITFNTTLQGVGYRRIESVRSKKLVVSSDVQGSKQVGIESELLQDNSRLINVDEGAIRKSTLVSANNLFKSFLAKTKVDDFEQDNQFVKNIRIGHTNDIHGRFEEDAGRFSRYIGIANIAAYYKTTRPDLILDAGDLFQGTGESDQDQGARMSQIASSIGIDVSSLGNHEFDFGKNNIKSLITTSPFYSANAVYKETIGDEIKGEQVAPGSIIKTIKGDLQVGIIPLTTEETAFKSNPANTTNIEFRNIIDVAKEEVAKLKAVGVNLIIVVSHVGDDPASNNNILNLANAVPDIDLVIDGHSHDEYDLGRQVNGVYLNQTGAFSQHLGEINFDFNRQSGKITRYSNRYLGLDDFEKFQNRLFRNENVDEKVLEAKNAFDVVNKAIAFHFPYNLANSVSINGGTPMTIGRTFETTAGKFFTDAMQWDVQTRSGVMTNEKVIAITNGGSIRASITPDKNNMNAVTNGDVLRISPFNNTLIAVDVNGEQLREIFNLSARKWQDGGFLQVSKDLQVTYELNAIPENSNDNSILENNRVFSIKYKGQEIQADERFVLVINDFLRVGGDGYEIFKTLNERVNGSVLTDALSSYGNFLTREGAMANDEFNQELYSQEFTPPSLAERVKINPQNDAARALLNRFENVN